MTDTATDPEARVKSLIEITQSLSEIFVEENDLLENARPRDLAPMQAEKARLAAAYAQSIRDIASDRTLVQSADTALLSKLRTITKTFEDRAARQRALLEGAQKASEGVVKAVAEEAAAADAAPGYKNGPQQNTEARSVSRAAPISLDESA